MDKKILLKRFQDRIQLDLSVVRESNDHTTTKGNFSEEVWKSVFSKYLPRRYSVKSGIVIDHEGTVSDQMDLLIHDDFYTPQLFSSDGTFEYIIAESIYGIFEVKQNINTGNLKYAFKKFKSFIKLKRTATTVVSASPTSSNGQTPTKNKGVIFGLLALESDIECEKVIENIKEEINNLTLKDDDGKDLNAGMCVVCLSEKKHGGKDSNGYSYIYERIYTDHFQEHKYTSDNQNSENNDIHLSVFMGILASLLQKIGTTAAPDILKYIEPPHNS